MKKHSKKSKTGRTWSVMLLDGHEVWAEPKLNNPPPLDRELDPGPDFDFAAYCAYCHRDVMLTYHLYHQVKLKELKRKLIKHAAMLAVSVTTLVMDLSIFFGWWV